MRLNGTIHIARTKDACYAITYTPLGQSLRAWPSHIFGDPQGVERFLVAGLGIEGREIATALDAVARNGRYAIHEVWLSAKEIQAHGLAEGRALAAALGTVC